MEFPSDALVGQNIREYLDLDDNVFDIKITANRGDCLSVRGIASEVSAINRSRLKELSVVEPKVDSTQAFPINVIAKEACPFYAGRIIKNINNSVTTPLWMVEKLRRSGIRSLGSVIDITNYVMLETGQPLYAFDFDSITETLNIRYAKNADKLFY